MAATWQSRGLFGMFPFFRVGATLAVARPICLLQGASQTRHQPVDTGVVTTNAPSYRLPCHSEAEGRGNLPVDN